jgi:putative Holliday junction resolvase
MGRLIGIDYGRKRVGIAVTDRDRIIASGLTTVGSHEIFSFLNDYMQKEDVDAFVVGMPRQMNNELSESADFVKAFVSGLTRKFPDKKIHLVDERFTSKMAKRAMIEGGLKKKKRQDKKMVDSISAALILQSFMESEKF